MFFILKGTPPTMPYNMIDGINHHMDLEAHCDPEFKQLKSVSKMLDRMSRTFG